MPHAPLSPEHGPHPEASFATAEELCRWLAAFIIGEVDPSRVLAVTAEVVGRFLRASRVSFGEINLTAERCHFLLDWTQGVPSIRGPQPFYPESDFGRLYAAGATTVVDDYSKLQLVRNEAELLDEVGGRYFIAVPLLRGGEVVAVFAASDHRPRRWQEAEIALMTDIGPMIWRAYEHLLALERLGEAERMLASLAGPDGSAEPPEGAISTFWLSTPKGQLAIPIDRVEWIEASRDYAVLHTASGNHVLRQTMTSLESGLDSAVMLRVHRSAFVAVAAIGTVEWLGRRMTLTLRSGTSIGVSAAYANSVRAKLGAVLPGRRVAPRPDRARPHAAANHVRGRYAPRPAEGHKRSSS